MAMGKDQHIQVLSPRISVVVPTLNEAHNLHHVLPNIPASVYETILVDGHSTDGTVEVAREILPTIRVIQQTGKGKGDALRAGFAACTGDIIVMLDADGSANPKEIPLFVEALLKGHEFAKGSRFIKGGGSNDITPLRRLGNFFLCTLVNVLFVTRFSDLCYGYNAFWKSCLGFLDIDCDGFEVETLMSLRARKARLKIVEVPSFEHRRIHGQSNLRTFRDGWRVLRTIMTERVKNTPTLNARKIVAKNAPEIAPLAATAAQNLGAEQAREALVPLTPAPQEIALESIISVSAVQPPVYEARRGDSGELAAVK
jgi:glycosyltransferase involved in cell wall biosynthesis